MKIYETLRGGLSSTEFSSNPLVTIIYSTKYFHLRDENIHFPFGEKKFSRHVFENLPVTWAKWISACTSIRAHVPYASVAICTRTRRVLDDTDLSPGVLPK